MEAEGLDRLVVAAQGGDREAFRLMVLETQRELRMFIAAKAASLEQVEEVLQGTYVAAFEHLAQYRPTLTFRAWLGAIARNQLVDRWRETRRFAHLNRSAMEEMLAGELVDQLEAEDLTDNSREQAARLAQCLERLPDNARAMIERRYQQGLPLPELARRFRRSTEAIGSALYRIRQGLRRCMENSP
jgi:RNA polymerase sigma-70 factor (ECF subfamily)